MDETYVGERKRPELDDLDWIIDKLTNYDRFTAQGLIEYLQHWNKVRPAPEK